MRALVDVCHACGIAVPSTSSNHAGGGFDDNSPLWYTDRMPYGNLNDSWLHGSLGGTGVRILNNDVKQFMIDNAKFFYQNIGSMDCADEVSVMDRFGGYKLPEHDRYPAQ
jgi:hypothetical protein